MHLCVSCLFGEGSLPLCHVCFISWLYVFPGFCDWILSTSVHHLLALCFPLPSPTVSCQCDESCEYVCLPEFAVCSHSVFLLPLFLMPSPVCFWLVLLLLSLYSLTLPSASVFVFIRFFSLSALFYLKLVFSPLYLPALCLWVWVWLPAKICHHFEKTAKHPATQIKASQ